MPVNWLSLPPDKMFWQSDQQAFLEARRRRLCRNCPPVLDEYGKRVPFEFSPFEVSPPSVLCPVCNAKGVRAFDRATIIAGRRWGKSFIGSIAGVEEASIPGSIGWACAPTAPKLHRYVLPAFQKLVPKEWVLSWSAEHLDLRLKNGSLIHFQTLEHPDQGRGQGLDWLWIDEVCELSEDHWNVIEPSLGDKQGAAFFTTSPRSYDWVYKRLYKPAEEEVPGFWALHARTSDNPIFQTAEGKEFLARQRETMPDAMFRQEYEADFVHFTGAVYGSALDSQILRTGDAVRQFIPEWPDIHPWRQVLVGLDSGADHPFGAVKLVATDKGLIVVGEYLERHKSFIEHAGALKRLAGASSIPTKWAMNKNERQAMIEFAQHGVYPMLAENEIVAGTERVKTWLHRRQLWVVEESCPKTIEQLRAYRWADTANKDGQLQAKEKVYKKDDELPDCIRYALMTWPELPVEAVVEQQRDLEGLSPTMRRDIERMRKFEGADKKEEPSVCQDFWG